MATLQFLGGLGLLIFGADALVRGASRLAAAAGLSSLVIGLTVVAFGTSAPELAVSAKAALSGQDAVSLGNVIGSNTFNVLMILGLSALIAPLAVASQLVRIDVPVMVGVSLLVYTLAYDGTIGRFDGSLLVLGIVTYLGVLLATSRRSSAGPAEDQPSPSGFGQLGRAGLLVLIGLAMLVVGSRWLVDAAVVFATAWGVSEVVIGLTIVAVGTSLPEVVTSVVASLRGERDIAIGNVVGSNLFNLLAVLGLAGLLAPDGVAVSDSVLRLDFPVMIGASVVCLPILFTGLTIDRGEGGLLLGAYLAYVTYLVLAATQHAALPAYSETLLYVAAPLVGMAMAISVGRALLSSRATATGDDEN